MEKQQMINIRDVENLLELVGKIACAVACISMLIWLYKDGTLFKNLFVTVGVIVFFLVSSLVFSRASHQAWCKFLGFRFPYIVYMIPFLIAILYMAISFYEGAYYGCNPNNPICKQQIEQRKLSQ